MKTKVKIIQDTHQQCVHNKNDIGYIDGYVRAADDRGYAVVVIDKKIDFVPLHALEAIGIKYNN